MCSLLCNESQSAGGLDHLYDTSSLVMGRVRGVDEKVNISQTVVALCFPRHILGDECGVSGVRDVNIVDIHGPFECQ